MVREFTVTTPAASFFFMRAEADEDLVRHAWQPWMAGTWCVIDEADGTRIALTSDLLDAMKRIAEITHDWIEAQS
jgi:hypothetical protein